jgi:hypothetical protein
VNSEPALFISEVVSLCLGSNHTAVNITQAKEITA